MKPMEKAIWPKPEYGIFDMDGTLLDSMGMWRNLGRDLFLCHGVRPPADLEARIRHLELPELAERCSALGVPGSPGLLEAELRGRIERFYREWVYAKPGVSDFLAHLRADGVRLYVATATDRPLAEAALERAGLLGYFQGMVTCREAGQEKQEGPAVYEWALKALRGRKRNTLVFEDVFYAVSTAKNAGFRVAAVYDAWEKPQAELRRLADYYIMSYEAFFRVPSLPEEQDKSQA